MSERVLKGLVGGDRDRKQKHGAVDADHPRGVMYIPRPESDIEGKMEAILDQKLFMY